MMGMKEMIKNAGRDLMVNITMERKRRREIRAFRDPRRVAIANHFPLSQQQKEQVDELFLSNYGKKVDYVWHQNYAAHTGHFDYRFIPGVLYIPEFEAFENQNKSFVKACNDKNFIPLVAQSVGVKMPGTIVSCTNGLLRDGENRLITPDMAKELVCQAGPAFFKPTVGSNSGRGCRVLAPDDLIRFTRDTLILESQDVIVGKTDFVIQELVKCHDSIRAIYPESVNTFRVISYLWKGRIEVMPVIIRIGQGGSVLDNAHQGGMFCAVHDDGAMGTVAVTEFNNQFSEHPDTHLVFASHRIEHLDEVIKAARKMHAAIPQLGVVNWDFTIDSTGNPVLIEANCKNGSVWLPQMAHGVAAFGERTAEVLQWLRFMKKLNPHERAPFVGGYME